MEFKMKSYAPLYLVSILLRIQLLMIKLLDTILLSIQMLLTFQMELQSAVRLMKMNSNTTFLMLFAQIVLSYWVCQLSLLVIQISTLNSVTLNFQQQLLMMYRAQPLCQNYLELIWKILKFKVKV